MIETLQALGIGIKGYLDKQKSSVNPYDLPYLGFESAENILKLIAKSEFALGIGDNRIRTRVAGEIADLGGQFAPIIHPSALVSPSSDIGDGTFISSGAIVNAKSSIARFCIINTAAIVEHECKLGEGVHVAPGAVLLGNVEVGNRTLIGGGSVIKQGIKIGSDVVIGAGSVVVTDVADGETFAGNPAKELH